MRKTISILVLVVVLCSSLSSCRKEFDKNQKKIIPLLQLQNKILYTSKQIGFTNIVKLNTNTKTKQILSSSHFKTEKPIFSPNKKKVVFQSRRKPVDLNIWDVYIMNLDGSELRNLTKELKLIQTNNQQIDYLFTPNSKQLLIRETIATSTINTQIMHQVNIDSLFVETLQPTHSVFNLLDCLFEKLKKSIPFWLDDEHFLLKNKNVLGSFNCSTQQIVPIVSFAEPIDDYYLSPDKQFIIFNIVTEKDIQTYLFDIKLKKTSTITPSFGKNDLQLHIFWLQDEKKFIYSASEYIMKSAKKEKQQFLFLFDLSTTTTTKLVGIDTIVSRFQSFSDHEFIGSYEYYDGPPDLIYIDLETKKIENIQENHEQPNIIRFYVQGENLIVFANTGFYIYNVKEEKITQNYINENLVFEKLYGNTNVLSTDQSQFYLVTRDKLIFFDNLGKQLHEEKLASFCNEPPNSDKSSFLYGSYTSPSELVYLEYGINETELYQYDLTTKKSTNITKELGEVKLFQVSPDQKQVAVLSTNPEVDTYFVNLISLATVSLIKKITSFPVPQKLGNNLAPNAIYDSAQLYSLAWSPDSQFLYFTSGGASRDINGNIINTLVINQVLSNGTGLSQLTDPDKISFQPSLSPDGKQIVYVSGEDLKLNIMNSDGTKKRILDSRNSASEIYQPIWSPDNKQLAYFQKRSSDSLFQFSIINTNGKTIKNFPITVLYHLPLLKDLHLQNTFSPNAINIAFIKNYRSDPYQSTIIFLKNLKEVISLKGNNIGFRWSPDGNQMLLFEATTNDQLIGIFLYDCATNTYIPISQDVQLIFDACWSPDGKQILYAGTDSKTGQIVFKTSNPDGSNQKVLFTFGENPQERPNSIEKIEKLVWLK